MRRATSSSSAAATSACGRRGSCSSSSRSSTSSCSRHPCADTARAVGTAASARRCGGTSRRSASARATPRRLPSAAPRRTAVHGIRAWCEANDVDAWFREAPMLNVATTESQLGAWDKDVRSCAALGAQEEIVALSADDVRGALRLPALPRRRVASAECDRPAGQARARLEAQAARAGRANPRADAGDPAPRGRERRDAARPRPGRCRCPRRQRRDGRIRRLSALARSRLEPHRADGASPGRARGPRLDRRRGHRRRPHARPLHAHDP